MESFLKFCIMSTFALLEYILPIIPSTFLNTRRYTVTFTLIKGLKTWWSLIMPVS